MENSTSNLPTLPGTSIVVSENKKTVIGIDIADPRYPNDYSVKTVMKRNEDGSITVISEDKWKNVRRN